jgi:nucleotide-binding universal stress UspA family protein
MPGQTRFDVFKVIGLVMVKGKKQRAKRARLQKLLVPVDFSPAALGAVRYAAALAARHRSHIVLLHVATSSQPNDAMKRARKDLARLCEEEGISIERRRLLVRAGVPFFEITETAKGTGTDLIILGRRNRVAMESMCDGHTLERVVRYARCPVLLVWEEGEEQARHDKGERSLPASA